MAPDIRPMCEAEYPVVERILHELELGHPSIPREAFWVAIDAGEIVGISNLATSGSSLYLSAVGVPKQHQGKEIATALLRELLKTARVPVFLYTQIPSFFARLGFVKTASPPEIPPREIYGCEACGGEKQCICMMRRPNASAIS